MKEECWRPEANAGAWKTVEWHSNSPKLWRWRVSSDDFWHLLKEKIAAEVVFLEDKYNISQVGAAHGTWHVGSWFVVFVCRAPALANAMVLYILYRSPLPSSNSFEATTNDLVFKKSGKLCSG
uniref:Uncharacterized protein n=1 Tax=Populus alba TaxID=43335 RepID=A0A4U5PS96_POPAL|nr:hypothetical protein D5086_0000197250 [Populus alba]